MNCDFGDWACGVGNIIGEWANSATGKTLEAIGGAIADGLLQMVQSLASMWITIPTPNLVSASGVAAPSSADAGLQTFLGWAMWLGLVLCVLSLIAYGGSIGLRTRYGDRFSRLGSIGLGVLLIGGAGAIIAALLRVGGGNLAAPAVAYVQQSISGVVAALAVLGLIIGGARMAWEQRAEGARKALGSLLTLALVSAGGLVGVAMLVRIADLIASEVMAGAAEGSTVDESLKLMIGASNAATGGAGLLIFIVVGALALIAAIIQVGLLVLRGAMLVLLAGVLPLAASATNTDIGRAWFQKTIAWLLAFIAYKPAAAIIYAMAFRLLRDDGPTADPTGIWANIAGVALMGMALVVLPAMMRFLVPVISSQTGGGGAGSALIAASHVMPSGARAGGRASAHSPLASQSAAAATPPTGAASAAKTGSSAAAGGGAKAAAGGAAAAAPVAIVATASAAVGSAATKAKQRLSDEAEDGPSGSGGPS